MSNERSASKNFPAAFSLEGQRVLLTGASGGLGQGIAACLVAAGAHVILSGTSTEKLEQLSKKLGPQTGVAAFDITHTDEAEAFAQAVEAEHGAISALINNAGITVKKPVAEMEQTSFESVLTTHVSGAFALTRAFLPQIVSRKGSILFTASMASFLGLPNVSGYAAAKSALLGLVRTLSVELAPAGVRTNAVAPGWFDTPMYREATRDDPKRVEAILRRIPMKVLGQPEDIGWAMTYLVSPAARYVTGQTLVVDGGAVNAL